MELSKYGLEWLPDDVGQKVETASMGHSDDSLLGTHFCDGIESRLHAWDERLTALEAESLHRVEFLGDELAEFIGPVNPVEDQ